jgi:inosine-uridine nucleoside N-ribohydrolase
MATAGEEMFNIKLLGVSACGGNVTVEKCTINARKMLVLASHEMPVYPGVSRPLVQPSRYAEMIHGKTGLDGTTTLEHIELTD